MSIRITVAVLMLAATAPVGAQISTSITYSNTSSFNTRLHFATFKSFHVRPVSFRTFPVFTPNYNFSTTTLSVPFRTFSTPGTSSTPQVLTQDDDAATNVRLTFYLIQADGLTNEDDAEIRPIVVELRKIFKFSGYRLASKSVLQAATDEGGVASGKEVVNDPEGRSYLIESFVKVRPDGKSAYLDVRLYPGRDKSSTVLIEASVNLSDGKTAVLGSALGGKDKAIILAVTPTIER